MLGYSELTTPGLQGQCSNPWAMQPGMQGEAPPTTPGQHSGDRPSKIFGHAKELKQHKSEV